VAPSAEPGPEARVAPAGPQERLELVRRGFAAYESGDVEATLEMLDPGIVVHASREFLNSGTFHGHEGFLRWIGQWNDAWESFEQEVLDLEPVGERHVVAGVHQTARGAGSGVVVEQDAAYLWDVREGRAVYLGLYMEREQARRVAREREAGDD
jgi:ketosteroid isomerase-like protein